MKLFQPVALLRLEAFCVFVGSLILYRHYQGSWLVFILGFLAPDISIAAYLASRSAGYRAYNLAHTYILPALLLAVLYLSASTLLVLTFIWFAHIAWDRLLAFGLKNGEDFWDTHLGRIAGGKRLWQQLVSAGSV
jgi:hypothetical protein